MGVVVGLDIGGTKVQAWVADPSTPRTPLAVFRVDTPPGDGDDLVDVLSAAVADADRRCADDGLATPCAVGVGVAGLVTSAGVVRFSPNLPGVVEFPVAERLASAVGRPVAVGNDANMAALAEWRVGAGEGVDDLAVVTLGTGIGAGLVVGGRLVTGANGFAGEPGHVVVEPDGEPCPCGAHGCWERYASGSGLAMLARRAVVAGRAPGVLDAAGGDVDAVRGEHVVAAFAAGDTGAADIVDDFAHWIAVGLAGLVTTLDLGRIVIGGGLVAMGEDLLDPVRRHLPPLVLGAAHRPPVEVVAAELGPEAGAVGAAIAAGDATVGVA